MLLPELFRDVPAADLGQQGGQGLAEALRLTCNLWSHKREKRHYQDQEQEINQGDGPSPAADPLFKPANGRIHEVGKKDCEQESDQGAVGHVQKSQRQPEQQHCEQDPGRACVNQGQQVGAT